MSESPLSSSLDEKHTKDVEMSNKGIDVGETETTGFDEIATTRRIQQHTGVLRYLRRGEEWLDEKLGIELQGIDRIPEEEKRPPSIINVFLMWFSMTCHVGTVPIGVLGPEFGLSLNLSIAAVVVGTVIGALLPAYTGSLGPKLGLRQIAISRYSFGFWGAKLCSVLNIIVGGGFGVVNVVVVGQILSAVSDFTMSITVGCVIIAVISYVVSIFGFKIIHTYEKYSWVAAFILLLVLVGQSAKHVDASIPSLDTGVPLAGAFLSIVAINFSSASGWCSIASDYYCNYPANTSRWLVFILTWIGIVIPTVFTTVVGTCIGNAALTAEYALYNQAYEDHGLGGLIREIYHPIGWSKFCLVILTFSVLGNNIAINYSSGLSLQLLGHYFHAVPRFLWSFLFALVVAILAIAGQQHLSTIVSNFVSLLGYWTISFTLVLFIEDAYFRRHEGYNLLAWDQPSKLPLGIAGVTALLAGYLAGGVPGMAQTWYIGPIAQKFGPFGGDVGIYLSAAITLLVYPIARTVEKKRTGR